MDREQFLEQVGLLRASGKSIRGIALELDVHRSRVERALKALAGTPLEKTTSEVTPPRVPAGLAQGRGSPART